MWCEECRSDRLIPVYMGQMAEFPYLLCETRVHPRVYGADYFFYCRWMNQLWLIPVRTGQMLNLSGRFPYLSSYCFPSSWTSATEPVCIILDWYIFADNTFWSILARNDTCPPIFLWSIPRRHHIFAPLTAFLGHSQTRI